MAQKIKSPILNKRINTYGIISTELACLSDKKLTELLDNARIVSSGIGGQSALLTIQGTTVFVKKIPLTDFERKPEHVMSTANIFELPLFYQYGIGSYGFNAWRELSANIMATNWVISGECQQFPLMYHWRVLPSAQPKPMDAQELAELKRDVYYWNTSQAVRNRLLSLHNAQAHIILLLEYIPQTLYQWLEVELSKDAQAAESAIAFVETQLKTGITFMDSHNFQHFDAHFRNILTDGTLIYFTDFGLSLSLKFELSPAEIAFFKTHRSYDTAYTFGYFMYCIVIHLYGRNNWEQDLQEYLDGFKGEVAPFIASFIKRYAHIARASSAFFHKLQYETKTTPYPTHELEKLLTESNI
ncbi:MAG: serine/threonine-protein kinase [Candidatus Dependentiae bacterium]|nr:serine/threonine-protein kinase [Candidatus Dependentiae bacterium]